MKIIVNRLIAWSRSREINYPFLLFLMGIVNIKLPIKIAAILFYLLYLTYRRVPLNGFKNGITLFYCLIPLVGMLGIVTNGMPDMSRYSFILGIGTALWLMSAAGIGLVSTTILSMKKESLISNLKLFFLINATVSFVQLLLIIIETNTIIPYWDYDNLKYGVSTGDYISGLFLYHSILNAAVNAFGAIFFIFQNSRTYALICLAVVCLATSNLIFIFTLGTIGLVLITRMGRWKIPVLLLGFSLVFYVTLSPQNVSYLATPATEKVISKPEAPASKNLQHPPLNIPGPEAPPSKNLQHLPLNVCLEGKAKAGSNLKDAFSCYLNRSRSDEIRYCLENYGFPGKAFSFFQTVRYLTADWGNFLFGSGTGRFSSRLALKSTGLNIQGSYPSRLVYIDKDYSENHLYTILYFFSRPVAEHSVVNFPYSIYNQIAGEYGLMGILLFLLIYLGFYFRNYRKLAAGKYLILLFLLVGVADYWFEMISLTIVFETMMMYEIINNGNADA